MFDYILSFQLAKLRGQLALSNDQLTELDALNCKLKEELAAIKVRVEHEDGGVFF